MKRLGLLLLLSLLFLPLYAYSLEVGGGYRYGTIEETHLILEAKAEHDGNSAFLRFHSFERLDLEVTYSTFREETRSLDLNVHHAEVPEEGGWFDFSTLFSERRTWGRWSLEGAGGIQLGVAYSPYSQYNDLSVSPLLRLQGFYKGRFATIGLFSDFLYPEARDWKAVPATGARLHTTVEGFGTIGIEGWMKAAEYLTDDVTVISDWGMKLFFRKDWP